MQQLIATPNKIKCINLDWLSVYCLEPKGVVMDAAYFKALDGLLKNVNMEHLSTERNSH